MIHKTTGKIKLPDYPDVDGAHKVIHSHPCAKCPTHIGRQQGLIDPEAEDIRRFPKELIAKEFLFVCAWRTDKLCKGQCDDIGITQEFLNELYKIQNNEQPI